jgi:hypothetical protein
VSGKALLILASALALAFAGGSSFAADQQQSLTVNGETLVRGGAPLPEFHLSFTLDEPGHAAANQAGGGSDDLDIALTSPTNGVFHFLFSPRPQFGYGYDRLTGSNRGFAGLTWSLFDNDGLYGSVGLAGSYDPNSGAPYDPLRRSFDQPLMLRGAIEFGYRLGEQHSLSLRLDESRAPEFRLNTETSDNLRLRYGLKF